MAEGYRPVPLAWPPRDEAAGRAEQQRFAERMAARRSVRAFSPDPVPRDLVVRAVETAATAPSGAHQQPWTFVLVGDPDLRARIRAAAEEEERAAYAGRLGEEWLAALAPLGTGADKPHLTDAPWLVVVFAQRYGLAPDGSRRKHYYVAESVGIACGLLIASLHLAGLATLTHTPSPMGFLADLLGRPRNEKAYLLLPVGYPAPDATVPDLRRRPTGEVLVEVPGDGEAQRVPRTWPSPVTT